jgi:hypothetical protein
MEWVWVHMTTCCSILILLLPDPWPPPCPCPCPCDWLLPLTPLNASSCLLEHNMLTGSGASICRKKSVASTIKKSGDRRTKSLNALVVSPLDAWRRGRRRRWGGNKRSRGVEKIREWEEMKEKMQKKKKVSRRSGEEDKRREIMRRKGNEREEKRRTRRWREKEKTRTKIKKRNDASKNEGFNSWDKEVNKYLSRLIYYFAVSVQAVRVSASQIDR